MKTISLLASILISGLVQSVCATTFTLYARNDFYRYNDALDSTLDGKDLYFDFGLGLDDIGGSGLSFHADGKATNYFYNHLAGIDERSWFDLTTGYLDWVNDPNSFMIRLGRQPYCNLVTESFDFDGLRTEIRPNANVVINAAAGLTVPTPYVTAVRSIDSTSVALGLPPQEVVTKKTDYFSNVKKGGMFLVDAAVTAIPRTTITAALGIMPPPYTKSVTTVDATPVAQPAHDLQDAPAAIGGSAANEVESDFRMALGAIVEPVSLLRLNGSGRFSAAQKAIDRYDLRATVRASTIFEGSLYLTGERGRYDSTNYFSVMLYEQLTEFGGAIDIFPDGGFFIHGDYHITSVKNEGADHFITFDISNRAITGGIVFGAGYHGTTLRPYAGLRIPMGKFFSLVGSGEFLWVDETDDDDVHNLFVASGGIRAAFFPVGLTIFPRVEYITNRYYKKDLRFLLTTNLLISHFRGAQR